MITLDASFLVQVIGTLVLMAVLNSLLYKPIRQMLQERESKMAAIREEAERLEKSAHQLLENFNAKLANARSEGVQKREELKAQAREEEKALIEESTKEATQKKQELLGELTAQIESARSELKAQAEAFAVEIAQKLLGRAI
ncbi:ATP synthase F0 sector subunit b' [Dissulfuribacter thermophilus]|uniref:ATP synthase subunit b n=1 Tax=Dissulfuribacter thermophilus TaxID=1156395 RepID=A0A1B9F766_9BACT|nr:ATP synthase F0 subunit B [Dissulfuribacter thermophilus]OCC15789.1 ATP synthase F0 sector subunit b' [Dissulfuribacter thermophilus]